MNILTIVLFGVTAAVLSYVLKGFGSRIAILLSLCAGSILLLVSFRYIQDVLDSFQPILRFAQIDSEIYLPVLKAAAIAVLVRITSAVCKDAEESAIAAKIELAGISCAMIVCMPLFTKIIELIGQLIE